MIRAGSTVHKKKTSWDYRQWDLPDTSQKATVGDRQVFKRNHSSQRSFGVAAMNRDWTLMIFGLLVSVIHPAGTGLAVEASFERREDVIYGRKFGTALTMDIFTPKKEPKGVGVIMVISGGFFSSRESIIPGFVRPLTERGYTVFAVLHGSQPRYTIPEIVQDINRAVRFIRYHAKNYGIDPERIGITGASAGGHLSLMLGTAGDTGNPNASDPVDRVSSRVQAVACFFPPTDFLN
jgi:acetyl esterase/lipase